MESSQESESQGRYALVPLDLIDEPSVPERETMDPDELAELAMSIADVGLIQPLTLKPVAARYEVTAGHRRLLGCRMVKLSPVPSIIMENGSVDPLAILVAENAHREDVGVVEEARFYQRVLVEMCGNDVDVLCAKVRRNRAFVEDRLLLLSGYPPVTDALQDKKISLAVAKELNKLKHPNQLMLLLDAAVRQGATARTVAEWRKELNADEDLQVITAAAAANPIDGALSVPGFQQQCFFCEDGADPHLMVTVHLHKPCLKMVEKVLGREPQSSSAGAN